MKKLLIGFLLSLLSLSWANAQSIDNYKFVSSIGTYTALTDGTALTTIPSDESNVAPFVYNDATKVALGNDNIQETIAGIDLGFDFTLGGETFNKFAVTGYGYILLGKADGDIEFTARDFLMNRMDQVTTAIGIATDENVYHLSVSYALTGEAGSHVFTVQFGGIHYAEADGVGTMNYQIKLYEADNRVEMIFDEYPDNNSWDGNRFNLGLKAGGKNHWRTPGSDWTTTQYNDNSTRTMWSLPGFPTGLTYTFSLPEPCDAPTYTITDLQLTPSSNEMAIDVFIDTVGKYAEGYLVLVSESPITEDPAGMNFNPNQWALGGTVIAVGQLSEFDPDYRYPDRSRTHLTFTHGNLQPNTSLYYTVYLSNTDHCIASYTQPVSKQMATATIAPEDLTITSATLSEVTLSATANNLDEEIAILMTTGQGERNYNRIYVGNFAPISADAEVGDKFTTSYTSRGVTTVDTTVVLYKGAAGAGITCPVALLNNRIYYFGAVSKGKDNGFYSTLVTDAEPYMTPAVLPFSDNFALNLSAAEDNPFIGGWAGTENFEARLNSNSKVSSVKSTMGQGPDQAVLVIPALDFPTDSNVIVNIAYSLDPYSYNTNKVEGDSIMLEISTDGGETFKVVKAVHKNTDNLSLGKVILSDYLGAKQAILRFRVVNANPNATWNVEVTRIQISALPFCPEPGIPYVSTTYGGTLGLTWSASENNETQWNISTAPVAAEDEEPVWSRALVVNEKPYHLTGLADREVYNVRIQAICGTRVSGWVESQVQAGRVPTFTEDFNNLKLEKNYYGEMEPQMPDNWQNGSYYISTYSGPYVSWYSGINKLMQYRSKDGITAETTNYNGALAYDMEHGSGYVGLLKTPLVELNPAENPKFTFEAAFGTWVDGTFGVMPEENRADTMQIALWVCDSNKFNIADNPNKVWKVTEMATWSAGQKIEIDLSEYMTEPKVMSVVMAIHTKKASGDMTNMLYLDNIGFVNTLPLARSVKVVSLSAEEAAISWVADPTVESWLVKLEGGTLAAPRFFETTGNTQIFDDLEEENTYTASVAHFYTVNDKIDTVDWVSVNFNTPALSCDGPTALAVSEISRKSAKLAWQGEAADGYRVRYRPAAKEGAEPMSWLEVEAEGTSYTLNNLALETEYECSVQSVCNKVAELESEFVAFDNFTTLALTCFTPTEVRILEIKPTSIDISWTGTSNSYQVAWTSQTSGSNTWTYSDIIEGDSYTITGLNYYSFYTFKVRGVCSAGDSSEWSDTRNFRTLPRPACPDPANLRVESLTQTSATLHWDAEEIEEGDIQSFILRHRLASVQAWDSIKDIKGNSYAITDMAPKTAYVWAVMTGCLDSRYSENWAQLRFETPAEVAVEGLKEQAGLYVATTQGQVHVMNPQSVQIDNIRIFSAMGQRLEQYAVRSRDNVILTTDVRSSIVIVEIESEGRFFRFKTLLP